MTGEVTRRLPPRPAGDGDGSRARRRQLAIVGVACLLAGTLFGVAAGSGGDPKVETVTQVDTVTRVKTERVPVVRVKTVTQVRRVVRTQTQMVTEQVAAPAEPAADATGAGYDDGGGGAADYAGMNCSEIGHSFTVTPGSDPQHDADNDGVACESY